MALLSGLPVEIIQQIATHLPVCTDILHFSLSSQKVHDAILATQAVYRELFLRSYDRPAEWEKYDYRRTYWWRQHVLEKFLNADQPPAGSCDPMRMRMLDGVKEIMFEARAKNFPYLHRFALKSTNALTAFPDLAAPLPKLLMTLQLILTNIAASSRATWANGSQEIIHSQQWAYGDGSSALFEKGGIDGSDLTRLWRTANFFLLHFKGLIDASDGELKTSGLKIDFGQVLGEGRGEPGVWTCLGEEEPVPRYWFGFYVYLEPEDIHKLRTATSIMNPLQDHYDGCLSIMELDITDTTFTGSGSDIEPFTVKGAISPLPPISSIPGWRRISFSNDYPEDSWLYEGCLLPGSKTIIGRWTTFDEDEIDDPGTNGWEGPFIMWAVSREDFEHEKVLRDAVVSEDDFLNP